MSKIKIGINGFGRIGRITFRAILKRNDVEVLAINDLLDVNHLAYLLKYDSVHGKLNDDISVKGNDLVVNGNRIRVTAEKNPSDIYLHITNKAIVWWTYENTIKNYYCKTWIRSRPCIISNHKFPRLVLEAFQNV